MVGDGCLAGRTALIISGPAEEAGAKNVAGEHLMADGLKPSDGFLQATLYNRSPSHLLGARDEPCFRRLGGGSVPFSTKHRLTLVKSRAPGTET